MRTGHLIPTVTADVLLPVALLEVTRKGMAMTAIVDEASHVMGIFTDGDLRRLLEKGGDIHQTLIGDVMTKGCTTVHPEQLAAEVVRIMQQKTINSFVVIDSNNNLVGALNMHDLLRAGVV